MLSTILSLVFVSLSRVYCQVTPTTNEYILSPLLPYLNPVNLFDGPSNIAQAPVPTLIATLKPPESLLMYYNYFAASMYCAGQIEDLTCDLCQHFNSDVIYLKMLRNETIDTRAMITVHSKRQEIVVTFRGSFNVLNFLMDFTMVSVGYKDDIRLHWGFYISTMSLYYKVVHELGQQLLLHPTYKVIITGHSLGGSMASMTIFFLNHLNQFPGTQYSLYTYGQPRTGNSAYVDYMNSLSIPMARVVARADIVPHYVPVSVGGSTLLGDYFHHHSNEYWDNGTGRYCSLQIYEDPTCSNSQGPGYTIVDHVAYLDVNYATCYFANPLPLSQLPFGLFDPESLPLVPQLPVYFAGITQPLVRAVSSIVIPLIG